MLFSYRVDFQNQIVNDREQFWKLYVKQLDLFEGYNTPKLLGYVIFSKNNEVDILFYITRRIKK
jgi:hypothetical protein